MSVTWSVLQFALDKYNKHVSPSLELTLPMLLNTGDINR